MEALSSSFIEGKAPNKGQRQFSRKLKWKSKGDSELNSDIQGRASKFGARSSYYMLGLSGIYLNRRNTRFKMMVSTILMMMQVTMGKKN
jgi:hypothetical protein